MNNAQFKKLIQKIEVDKDRNVDIYLCFLGELRLDETTKKITAKPFQIVTTTQDEFDKK